MDGVRDSDGTAKSVETCSVRMVFCKALVLLFFEIE
jgi:hypothetical protein